MASFAHIINTVSEEENAELFGLQQTTFTSLLKAKKYTPDDIRVDLHVVQLPGGRPAAPAGFVINPGLSRSVNDVAKFRQPRKLPLLKDILDSLYNSTQAEYLVYTNLDICVMPFFYETINEYAKKGHDAFIINRRRIPHSFINEKPELSYAEVGRAHPGYDAFVIAREVYSKFVLKDTCIGAPYAGSDLFYNIFCFAKKPALFTDKHLTYHIGMELYKEWAGKEYEKHNYAEWMKVLKELEPHLGIAKFPGANLGFFKRHFKWLMNPTLDYPTMARLDFKDFSRKKTRPENNIPRGMKARYLEWLLRYINF